MAYKNKQSIFGLFLGTLLVLLYIDFHSISTIITLVGAVILTITLFRLRNEISPLKIAFFASLALTLSKTVNLLVHCFTSKGALVFGIIDTAFLLILLYNVFDGLKIVLSNCGDEGYKFRLTWCFPLFVISVISIIAALIFPVAKYICPPICILSFAFILYKLIKANKIIKNTDYVIGVERFKISYKIIVVAYAVILAGASATIVLTTNHTDVTTDEKYNMRDCKNTLGIVDIRDNMIDLGFPEKIVFDLADSEVMRYKELNDVSIAKNTIETDGGKLDLTTCTSYIGHGTVRFLQYYDWITPPQNGFVDVIGLNLVTKKVITIPDEVCVGNNLYTVNENGKNVTYRLDLAEQDLALKYPKIKYNVKTDVLDQRGYYAISTILTTPTAVSEFEIRPVYSHQFNAMNFPYSEQFDFFRLGVQTKANPGIFTVFDEFVISQHHVPEGVEDVVVTEGE